MWRDACLAEVDEAAATIVGLADVLVDDAEPVKAADVAPHAGQHVKGKGPAVAVRYVLLDDGPQGTASGGGAAVPRVCAASAVKLGLVLRGEEEVIVAASGVFEATVGAALAVEEVVLVDDILYCDPGALDKVGADQLRGGTCTS